MNVKLNLNGLWLGGGLKALLGRFTRFSLRLTTDVNVAGRSGVLSLALQIFGIGVELDINADDDMGAGGVSIWIRTPVVYGVAEVGVTWLGAWAREAKKDAA